jgi:DNA-binding MarR family transcriptional regulator
MKQEFMDFLNALMNAAPDVVKEKMTPNIEKYLEVFQDGILEKPALTDNGKKVLIYMQQNPDRIALKARDIADELGLSSRGVSGSMRKLVSDGFVDKMGESPAIYSITEKGKNFIID